MPPARPRLLPAFCLPSFRFDPLTPFSPQVAYSSVDRCLRPALLGAALLQQLTLSEGFLQKRVSANGQPWLQFANSQPAAVLTLDENRVRLSQLAEAWGGSAPLEELARLLLVGGSPWFWGGHWGVGMVACLLPNRQVHAFAPSIPPLTHAPHTLPPTLQPNVQADGPCSPDAAVKAQLITMLRQKELAAAKKTFEEEPEKAEALLEGMR